MKKIILFFILFSLNSYSQVGIGTAQPNSSAMLDIYSINKGVLFPRLSSPAIVTSPVEGLLVYDTVKKCLVFYNGTSWVGRNCLSVRIKVIGDPTNVSSSTGINLAIAGVNDILNPKSIPVSSVKLDKWYVAYPASPAVFYIMPYGNTISNFGVMYASGTYLVKYSCIISWSDGSSVNIESETLKVSIK